MRNRKDADQAANARRHFMKTMVVGGGAAAVTALAGGASASELPAEKPAAATPEHAGYHLTPHIRDYYKIAGF